MALTRKALAVMGIDEAQVDEIIKLHLETVNPIKDERDELKSSVSKLEAVEKELSDLKQATKNGDRSPYKVKYEALVEQNEKLQKEFDDYKDDVKAQADRAARETAYKSLLRQAGIEDKRIDTVTKLANLDEIELDESGAVKDSDKMLEAIKAEWADIIPTITQQGAHTSTPPASTGVSPYRNADEIMAIEDTATRQRAIAENHEMFGF